MVKVFEIGGDQDCPQIGKINADFKRSNLKSTQVSQMNDVFLSLFLVDNRSTQ